MVDKTISKSVHLYRCAFRCGFCCLDRLSWIHFFGIRFGANASLINSTTTGIDNFERQFLRVLNKVYQTIERSEVRIAEQDRRDAIKLEWQQVALVIDR